MTTVLMVIKGNLRRQKNSFIGVLFLVFLIGLFSSTILSIRENSQQYEQASLTRMGFGDYGIWLNHQGLTNKSVDLILAQEGVAEVREQGLIYAAYDINGHHSDSDGQLVAYEPTLFPYRIFNPQLSGFQESPRNPQPGQIYVPAVFAELYGVTVGNTLELSLFRQQEPQAFEIIGFFEDPFMGSTMIDMKSFLMNADELAGLQENLAADSRGAYGRNGALLHVDFESENPEELRQISRAINENETIATGTAYQYTPATITEFMLILQDTYTSLALAFILVLVLVTLVVIGYSISASIQQNYRDMGILKTQGMTSRQLRGVQVIQYLSLVVVGLALGALSSNLIIPLANQMMVTTIGLLLPNKMALGQITLLFSIIILFYLLFIFIKTSKINQISPISVIRGHQKVTEKLIHRNKINPRWLTFSLSMRQLISNWRHYLSAGVIAILLVFFLSLVTRMSVWIGPNGEGMMEAFNVADLDIGVERLGEISPEEVAEVINEQTAITDSYQLAMPKVQIDGAEYTANVIDQPNRLRILAGRTVQGDNEVVLTETLAKNLGLGIGENLTVVFDGEQANYQIVGIYQCANQMGNNIGMSDIGFTRINSGSDLLWCTHYLLADSGLKNSIQNALTQRFGGDVHVHQNTWSGLEGIIAVMQLLLVLMYIIVAIFSAVVIILTGSKILTKERTDLGIYKAIGVTSRQLRINFSIRYTIVAAVGAALGTIISMFGTDPLVSLLLQTAGISTFHSSMTISQTILPVLSVTVMYGLFSYLLSFKMKQVQPINLIR